MKTKNIAYILGGLAVLILALASIFVLDETQQAIVTQFGKPVGGSRTTPGLHFKAPLIHKVQILDKRYLKWDGDPNQVPTQDKKFIFVDTYARWQITDPLQFYIRLRDERSGQSRLDDILDGETRNAVASVELIDIVRSMNRTPETSEAYLQEIESLDSIKVGREKIEKVILEKGYEIEHYREIRKIFLEPSVNEDYELQWKRPRVSDLTEFYIEGHQFKEDTIKKYTDKIKDGAGTIQQTRLEFF